MKKSDVIRAFDKASGFGEEFGDFADYHEVRPIREEFIRLIEAIHALESQAVLSTLSPEALSLLDKYEEQMI